MKVIFWAYGFCSVIQEAQPCWCRSWERASRRCFLDCSRRARAAPVPCELQHWHALCSGLDTLCFACFRFQSLLFPYIDLYIWPCSWLPWVCPQLEALCSGSPQLVRAWITIPKRNLRISIIGMNRTRKVVSDPICWGSLLAFDFREVSQCTQTDPDTVPGSLHFV